MRTLVNTALLLLISWTVQAASITSFRNKDNKEVVVLSGEIEAGDADRLAAIINSANASGRLVSGVRLNSPGGQLYEGVKLADIIRTAKIATVVQNGASCASACFVAFSAGAEKYVSYQASLGVHGASDHNGQETESANAATVAMAKIVKELGVPPAIIGRMVVTPPSEVVWLTPDELQAMGTKMTGKPAQLPQPSYQASPSGQPMQLPQAQVPQNRNLDWKQFTDWALNLSRSQNNGVANTSRVCQPELKTCTTGVFFKSSDGNSTLAKVTENLDGVLIRREVCEFNQFGDIRTCLNWDTKEIHKDMKDAKGNWSEVSN